MALDLPVVWSDACLAHTGTSGPWVGVPIEGDELPERATRIRATLEAAGAAIVPAVAYDDTTLLSIHDAGLVEFLRSAHRRWVEDGYPVDPGQPQVVGYIFPTPGLLSGIEPFEPPVRFRQDRDVGVRHDHGDRLRDLGGGARGCRLRA